MVESPPFTTTLASADGAKHTIEMGQIIDVLDLTDNFFKTIDEQATLEVEKQLLPKDVDIKNTDLLGAVVAYKHYDKNFYTVAGLKTNAMRRYLSYRAHQYGEM